MLTIWKGLNGWINSFQLEIYIYIYTNAKINEKQIK